MKPICSLLTLLISFTALIRAQYHEWENSLHARAPGPPEIESAIDPREILDTEYLATRDAGPTAFPNEDPAFTFLQDYLARRSLLSRRDKQCIMFGGCDHQACAKSGGKCAFLPNGKCIGRSLYEEACDGCGCMESFVGNPFAPGKKSDGLKSPNTSPNPKGSQSGQGTQTQGQGSSPKQKAPISGKASSGGKGSF